MPKLFLRSAALVLVSSLVAETPSTPPPSITPDSFAQEALAPLEGEFPHSGEGLNAEATIRNQLTTKEILIVTLERLKAKPAAQRITAVDLATEAGVPRRTFYYYMRDNSDMARKIREFIHAHNACQQILRAIERLSASKSTWGYSRRDIAREAGVHYKTLLSYEKVPEFQSAIQSVLASRSDRLILKGIAELKADPPLERMSVTKIARHLSVSRSTLIGRLQTNPAIKEALADFFDMDTRILKAVERMRAGMFRWAITRARIAEEAGLKYKTLLLYAKKTPKIQKAISSVLLLRSDHLILMGIADLLRDPEPAPITLREISRRSGVTGHTLRNRRMANPVIRQAVWNVLYGDYTKLANDLLPDITQSRPLFLRTRLVAVERKRLESLTLEEIADKTVEFQTKLRYGATLDQITDEALAVFAETARRLLKDQRTNEPLLTKREQFEAALDLLHGGPVAVEQPSGQGKTLTIALAAYVRALTGEGVQIHTVNHYLARYGWQQMGPVFATLGLSASRLRARSPNDFWKPRDHSGRNGRPIQVARRTAYQADIIYGPYVEFMDDFLLDEWQEPDQRRQWPSRPSRVLIDEGDVPLLDEAIIPVVIAYPDHHVINREKLSAIYGFATRGLKGEEDYILDRPRRLARLTETGIVKLRMFLRENPQWKYSNLVPAMQYTQEAIAARELYREGEDYILQPGPKALEVVLLDRITGRARPQMTWEGQLMNFIAIQEEVEHQRLVALRPLPAVYNMITPQSYYTALEDRVGILSATLMEERDELEKTYNITMYRVPPSQLPNRHDHPPQCYLTSAQKRTALVSLIQNLQSTRDPILMGTQSIEDAEWLKGRLPQARLLTAQNEDAEETIIEEAGRPGAITDSAKLTGRGTDIRLFAAARGTHQPKQLNVISTEPSFNRRSIRQFLSRGGRWDDPTETWSFASLDDRIFQYVPDLVKEVRAMYALSENGELPPAVAADVMAKALEASESSDRQSREQTRQLGEVTMRQRLLLLNMLWKDNSLRTGIKKGWAHYLGRLSQLRCRGEDYLAAAPTEFEKLIAELPRALTGLKTKSAAAGSGSFALQGAA